MRRKNKTFIVLQTDLWDKHYLVQKEEALSLRKFKEFSVTVCKNTLRCE